MAMLAFTEPYRVQKDVLAALRKLFTNNFDLYLALSEKLMKKGLGRNSLFHHKLTNLYIFFTKFLQVIDYSFL